MISLKHSKLHNLRSFTFVHSSEALIKHTEINFKSILFITHVKEMPNLHTPTHTYYWFILGCKVLYSLRGEGRRGWEGRLTNGVRMNSYDFVRSD